MHYILKLCITQFKGDYIGFKTKSELYIILGLEEKIAKLLKIIEVLLFLPAIQKLQEFKKT